MVYVCQDLREGFYTCEVKEGGSCSGIVQKVEGEPDIILVAVENAGYLREGKILALKGDSLSFEVFKGLIERLDRDLYEDYHFGLFTLSVFKRKGQGYEGEIFTEGYYDEDSLLELYGKALEFLKK